MSKNVRNILIMKPSALGDVVLALPALSALRRSFPDAKISWLIRPEFAPVLENHPALNEIILFDRKFLGKAWYNPKALKSLIGLIRQLRQGRYDITFDFQGLIRTAVLAWLSGTSRRIGPADAREFAYIFYTDKIEQCRKNIHLVDFYLKMVETAGAGCLDVQFDLPASEPDVDSVKQILSEYGFSSEKYVVFVPGSAQIDKCWPAERFAELAGRISEKFHLPVIAIGTNSEKDYIEKIKVSAKVKIVNLAGRTTLKQLIELLRSAALVVSNDTGPGHIAAALGVPLVIMYSWSNPARISPYGRAECMVACEPYSRGLDIKSTDPKHNVRNISVDEVFSKVCQQLKIAK